MKPVIIGAGPAGLSAAYELTKRGVTPVVLEADTTRVGGLSQTVMHRGFRFDIGGHRFFSKNPEIESLWTDVLGDDMLRVQRASRIYYSGRFFDYPLRPWNALVNLGFFEALRCLLSYAWARVFPRKPVVSFEDWVVNRFGARLFRIFFKTYTEKVWGMPTRDISAEWAAQRIGPFSLSTALRRALRGDSGGAGVVKTLVDTFRYPRHGPGMMWERMADIVRDRGGEVRLGCRVVALERGAQGIERVVPHEGEPLEATHVISTMPLRALIAAMRPAAPYDVQRAALALKYRDFLTVALIVEQRDLFPDHWLYIHDPRYRVGRVQNYGNWSPDMVPDARFSVLGLEYFCFEGDDLWTAPDASLVELARREASSLRLVDAARVVDAAVCRAARAYPVYDASYQRNVGVIRDWLEREVGNLQVVGRNGMHRYNNQDHAMMTGLLAARNLCGEHWDVWKVNGDAEYLETVPDDSSGRVVPRVVRDR